MVEIFGVYANSEINKKFACNKVEAKLKIYFEKEKHEMMLITDNESNLLVAEKIIFEFFENFGINDDFMKIDVTESKIDERANVSVIFEQKIFGGKYSIGNLAEEKIAHDFVLKSGF
jgi:hypothetical protein